MVSELRDPIIQVVDSKEMRLMFDGLTDTEKLFIELRVFKRWSIEKISQKYGLSKQKIYYIIRKAKEKIKNNCENKGIF